MASRLPPGASRVFHRAIDGTIPYFRSEGNMQEEGRLPEGADPAELLSQGYVEADRDAFLEARTRLDPLRSIPERAREVNVHVPGGRVRMDPEDADAYANEVDAAYAGRSPEDDALAELSGAMDYAGLGRTQAAPPPPRAPTMGAPRPATPRGDTPTDVDDLGAAWDDFYGRANAVEVQNVPSTVPLASRMGGEPLPRPSMASAAAPPPGAEPEQGPEIAADDLRGAQSRASTMRGLAGVGRGFSRVGAALAGVRPEEGAAAAMEQGAEAQVREYLQRRQQSEAEKASAEKAALADPTSPASQRFQALVSRAFGSVYTPEQIAQMTAADAPLVGKYGEMVRAIEDRAAARASEQEGQQAQLAASATEAEKQRAFEAKENARNRANAREIAGMRQEQAGDKAAQDFERRMSERNVGGFEIDPSNPPTAEGAKRMAAVVDARAQIRGSLDRLEALFKQYGPEMGGGIAQEQMQSELGNIGTQLRLFNQMGVPNLNDYAELAKQIPQTAGVGAWFTRNATTQAKFKPLRDQLDRAVTSTATAYKFKPTGGGPQRVGMQGNMNLEAEDQQALEWARANPGDPRAQQILTMNGG